MKKIINCLLLVFSILLVGCTTPQEEPRIISIVVTSDSSLEYTQGEVEIENINIQIKKDNGEITIKPLSDAKINTNLDELIPGINKINCEYENFKFAFDLIIKEKIVNDTRFTYREETVGVYITGYVGQDEHITLPTKYNGKQVIGIESSAFLNNNIINSVIIPNNYIYIGEAAFYNCEALQSIYVPSTVKDLNAYALNSSYIVILGKELSSYNIIDQNWINSKTMIYENIESTSLKQDETFQYLVEENNVTILSYLSNEEEVIIPSEYDKKSVTKIGKAAFYNNKNIKKVTMSDTIEIVDQAAFSECSNLETVVFSTNLKRIEKAAFGYCTNLVFEELPNKLEFIGNNAFNMCEALVKITIPESVTTIDTYAFAWCMQLKELYIHNTLENMNEGAIYACSKLKVYCEFENKPISWHEGWNPSNRPVEWNYEIK